jgi:hypothetical protein
MRGKGIQAYRPGGVCHLDSLPLALRCNAQPGMTGWEDKNYIVADGDVMHFRFNT